MVRRLWAPARWDLWRDIKMSPAPVQSSWLLTNWLRWEPPRWEMRAQQLNTIDIDVETNCITRPRRSELTCSAHDCCAAVLIRQCQWAAAESKTNHDPGGSSRHGVTWPAHLCFYAAEQVGAWEQESSKCPQRAEGRISSFRIITFAAAFCWQDATQRAHVCSDSNCNDCSKILFVSFASFFDLRTAVFKLGRCFEPCVVWTIYGATQSAIPVKSMDTPSHAIPF